MYLTQASAPNLPQNSPSLSAFAVELERRILSRQTESDGAGEWFATSARPSQRPPAGEWRTWLILAGRGWGKSRTGAEWLRSIKDSAPRMGIVAPTFADARDTCIEGESGLRSICNRGEIARWNRSMGELEFGNGARVKLFSGDQPDRLRGPQHYALWYDELAAFKYAQAAWDMGMFGLRLGDNPRCIVTTTPRPIPLIRRLLKDTATHVTTGSTYENRDNLAPAFFADIVSRYEGTRLGRQELNAELLEDVEGALWTRDALERDRATDAGELARIVVGVDPKVNATAESETGIIVAAQGKDKRLYVLDDASINGTPEQWARQVVATFRKWRADRVVVERNQGGDMVAAVLRAVDANLPIREVYATRGKWTRAEPIAALYEQGKVRHVGAFPKLEDQLCTWLPGEDSPDRLDAMVWALTDLSAGVSTLVDFA
jgi:predicted phage terminase large subunit-like protein